MARQTFLTSWMHVFLLAVTLLFSSLVTIQPAQSAVAIMYHRFGESSYSSTNITIAQFEAHIKVLKEGDYLVMAMPVLVDAIKNGKPVPENAVVITIDDTFESIYLEAWPRLRAANLPFTVFASTAALDSNSPGSMSWAQIREMHDAGVTIGNHTHTHLHMADHDLKRNMEEIQTSQQRFKDVLGAAPTIFAYPYGETSAEIRNAVANAGFDIAFGQHSGAFDGKSNRFFLPRFALNEQYGDIPRFRRIIQSLPLMVRDILPDDPLVHSNPPALGFTIDSSVKRLENLACYHSQFGKMELLRLGSHRIEVRFPEPFRKGRSRLNCTLPVGANKWRWFGTIFYVQDK